MFTYFGTLVLDVKILATIILALYTNTKFKHQIQVNQVTFERNDVFSMFPKNTYLRSLAQIRFQIRCWKCSAVFLIYRGLGNLLNDFNDCDVFNTPPYQRHMRMQNLFTKLCCQLTFPLLPVGDCVARSSEFQLLEKYPGTNFVELCWALLNFVGLSGVDLWRWAPGLIKRDYVTTWCYIDIKWLKT